MSPAERDRIARVFARIASAAGVAVMEVYESDFTTRTKADLSPVSDADERAEAIILEHLARELPGVGVLAEEAAAREGLKSGLGGLYLLVDPVDGTKEFIKKNGQFTVNIALIEAGRPLAGCVYAPARNDLFFGGAKAFLVDGFLPGGAIGPGDGREIRTRAYPAEGMIAVTSSSHLNAETQALLDRLPITGKTAIGSSLKFCLLARAEADVYPRWGPTMEWDTAAGQAVLEAAGGCVTQPNGKPFLYGKADADYLNGPFIAWGREPRGI